MTAEDREAAAGSELLFVDKITGGKIPKNFIPAIEKGFRQMLDKGPLAGYPVVGLTVEVNDGSYHDVDSSDMAFMLTAQECFREHFQRMKPVLLEPIMLVEIECPENFQGPVVGQISSKRGMVVSTDTMNKMTKIIADVPLAETFGYSTDLRSHDARSGHVHDGTLQVLARCQAISRPRSSPTASANCNRRRQGFRLYQRTNARGLQPPGVCVCRTALGDSGYLVENRAMRDVCFCQLTLPRASQCGPRDCSCSFLLNLCFRAWLRESRFSKR